MTETPDSAIRTEPLVHGVRLFLPVRPLGKKRWMGIIPILFGLVFSGFSLVWLAVAIWSIMGRAHHDGLSWSVLLPVLFSLPFLAAGCFPIAIGLFAMFGSTEIELNQMELRSVERVGFLHWTRKHKREGINHFRISNVGIKRTSISNTEPFMGGDFSRLYAEFSEDKPVLLAGGYPVQWLRWVADTLAARALPSYLAANPQSHQPVVIETASTSAPNNVAGDVTIQPASSTIKLKSEGQRVVFTIPPVGILKGSKGLFIFGLFWCCFMTFFTTFTLFNQPAEDVRGMLPWLAFIVGFWAIGICLLLGAVNMGKRRAMIVADTERLSIAQITLFRQRKWEWKRDEIKAIRLGPSGMEINERPIQELQIHPVSGKKTGLFTERDEEELRWLATQLRKTMQLPSS